MRQELSPLILSAFDIEALRIGPEEITRAVEVAFRGFSTGDSVAGGKMSMALGEGRHFTAKGGALLSKGYAAVKWYGVVAENARRGMPEFVPLVILSSVDTGLPLAIMDAQWLTAARTAGLTAAAASILAKPDSSSIGFVACGTQAEANLAALLPRFELKRLTAYSRSRASAERLADKAVSLGLSAVVATQPEDAVADMDIVITSVPRLSERTRFLDAGWLSPGAFVSMVDMGFSWDATTATQLGEIFTDAFEPGTRSSREMLNIPGPFAADLAELIVAPARWRHQSGSRRAFVFAGAGIADAAAAAVVYERAAARG
jgi:alanine dehydrogenase